MLNFRGKISNSTAEKEKGTTTLARPVSFARHDQHNLEMKVAMSCAERRESIWVDLYLFLPHSLQTNSWSRQEIRQDFNSRLRLGVQQSASHQEMNVTSRLQRVLQLTKSFSSTNSSLILDELFHQSRELGAILGEWLKFESRQIRGDIITAHSRSVIVPDPEGLVRSTQDQIIRLDRVVRKCDEILSVEGACDIPVLRLLRQYVHNLYTDFLGKLLRDQVNIEPSTDLENVWAQFTSSVEKLRATEAKAYLEFEGQLNEDDTEAHEIRLIRLGQIKKFFQSQMFIEVQRKETIRRFSEPAAAGAAAFAALWAGAFEYFSQPKLQSFGLQGAVVICTGVALYVLKDRLKDQMRSVFTKKLADYLPEAEQTLLADSKKIGKIREWFRLLQVKELELDVLKVRRSADLCEAEEHLPEDVVHLSQEFEMEPIQNSYGEFNRTIQQTLRLNIERFLKRLDDPYKTIGIFGGDGELKLIKSHRVYHLHAAIRVRRSAGKRGLSERRFSLDSEGLTQGIYRIVLDKQGISRVQEL